MYIPSDNGPGAVPLPHQAGILFTRVPMLVSMHVLGARTCAWACAPGSEPVAANARLGAAGAHLV